MRRRRPYVEAVFVALVIALAALWIVAASGQSTTDTVAWRKAQITECEAHGGIPVVVAGPLSSRGIACAQPLGD